MQNDWFDAIAIKERLDRRIECLKLLKETDDLSEQIGTTITPDYIHITSGIDMLADILGEKLEEAGKLDEYVRYGFWYGGTQIMQLSKERMV